MHNKIDFFQFDNLVKNKVPFLFLNSAESLTSRYDSLYQTHLQNYEVLCQPEAYTQEIEQKKLPKEFPIVMRCSDDHVSIKAATDLSEKGFINVYILSQS